jgi:hypothetical protein
MSVCPFDGLKWDCPQPGDGRKNQGHIWRIALRGQPKGTSCAICGKKYRGK